MVRRIDKAAEMEGLSRSEFVKAAVVHRVEFIERNGSAGAPSERGGSPPAPIVVRVSTVPRKRRGRPAGPEFLQDLVSRLPKLG
jgi:hypothetical protein